MDKTSEQARGAVIEFDFAALDGGQKLFDIAKSVLAEKGINLTIKLEAKHLSGGNYQGGIQELLGDVGVDANAIELAGSIAARFADAVTDSIPDAVNADFKAFVKTLADAGVKVVIATRANVEKMKAALADFDPAKVAVCEETSPTYGNCKWDAWRRATAQEGLVNMLTVGVTGSGLGVKSALIAGLSALAVEHPHVSYQDFGGADDVVAKLDASAAKLALAMLHLA